MSRTSRWTRAFGLNSRERTAPYFGRHAGGIVGAAGIAIVLAVALLAPVIAPFNPTDSDLGARLRPPAWAPHALPGRVLGTDQLGRDLLSRTIYGARLSLAVAGTAVVASGVVGVPLGMLAGYYGGAADQIIMRIVDVQLAFPFVLLAILVLAVLRPNLFNIVGVLVISTWVLYCRLVRAQTMSLKTREFVTAGRAIGCNDVRILARHILPNLFAPVVVVATFQIAQVVVTESVLSFLGVGIQPPTPAWGLIMGEGREYLDVAWWITTFPGLALVFTVIAFGLFGDWLRDRLDPTIQI